jgi:hypothetical protein
MINVGLFIKKDKVFDSGINGKDTNEAIQDFSKSWITNQWKDYYIRIVAGTGQGYYFKCTSNDSYNCYFDSLPFNLDTTSQYEIYAEISNRVELFKDEKISLTSSIQNSNDIGKLFTDYSQSFTIPASKHNNAIFTHWYESDVDNGYDHRKRYNAFIEIDTLTFKVGNIQLEKANKSNGFIESYTVTFYGNLTQLKDKFKDTKLRDLISSNGVNWWDLLNHTYNSSEVINRITSTVNFNQVGYPLIGSQKKYYYKNGISTEDISLSSAPIVWNELFPAVPIGIVWGLIQQTFGLTFTGSFFELDQWIKLYLYLKNAEKLSVKTEVLDVDFLTLDGTFPELNLTTNVLTPDWNFGTADNNRSYIADIRIWATTATPFTLYVYRDGLLFATFPNLVSDSGVIRVDRIIHSIDSTIHTYNFKIQADSSITFTSRLFYYTSYGDSTGGFHYVQRFVQANNYTNNLSKNTYSKLCT